MQTAVTAYLKSKQLLLFTFTAYSEEQKQITVSGYLKRKQLLLFAFTVYSEVQMQTTVTACYAKTNNSNSLLEK